MKLKNIIATSCIAGLAVAAFATGAYAESGQMAGDPCKLIDELGNVFRTLRTLAFIGAAFLMAGWAWGYISSGELGKEGKWAGELKGKGVALIVGFVILFAVGMILQFLPGISGCSNVYTAFN